MLCSKCNGSFEQKVSNQKYCSSECRIAETGYIKKGCGEGTCGSCQKVFSKDTANQVYCSADCREKETYEKIDLGIRCCDLCGQPFKRLTANQRFCKEDCRKEVTTYKSKWPISRFCLNCGFVFSAVSPFHFFCQKSCRVQYKSQDEPWVSVIRPCIECKNQFLSRYGGKHCSEECAKSTPSQPTHFFLFQRDKFKCLVCDKGPLSNHGTVLELKNVNSPEPSTAANNITICKSCSGLADTDYLGILSTLEAKNSEAHISHKLKVKK